MLPSQLFLNTAPQVHHVPLRFGSAILTFLLILLNTYFTVYTALHVQRMRARLRELHHAQCYMVQCWKVVSNVCTVLEA